MRIPARALFFAWIVLWVVFDVRPFLKQSYLTRYRALLGRSLEERRAIVYGEKLYAFLKFAKGVLPESSTYMLRGLDAGSVDRVRAYYYLYPDLTSDSPLFILAHDSPRFTEPGYARFAAMDDENVILKLE